MNRCPTCHSENKDEPYLVQRPDPISPENAIEEWVCADEWHEMEPPHPGNCICPDHSDEPYQEQ